MMALSRRNTTVKKAPHDFLELVAAADIVLCGGGYMPYDVASIGYRVSYLLKVHLNLNFTSQRIAMGLHILD